MKLIYLEWRDVISGGSGWHYQDEMEEWEDGSDYIIKQCGFVINETPKYLLLCGHFKPKDKFTEEQFGHLQKIPKALIVKRKVIK